MSRFKNDSKGFAECSDLQKVAMLKNYTVESCVMKESDKAVHLPYHDIVMRRSF